MRALGVHGVRIHAEHPCGRKPLVQLLLQLLRAGRFGEQAHAALRHLPVILMDARSSGTSRGRTPNDRSWWFDQDGHSGTHAAHAAADHAAVAAPVEEQDGLLSLFERADKLALEVRSDDAAPSLAGQTAHVRDDDLGQSGTEKTLCERENRIFSLLCARNRVSTDGVAEPSTSSASVCAARYFATSRAW